MPDQLSPTDVVPALRSDLKLADPVQGAGEKLVTVADPLSGKSMAFRGFELSIARMLNGQRTASDVVAAAEAIGLPISLEGLSGFVRKLKALGFLAHPLDGPVQKPTTWGERREWSDDIRSRYQVALKEARSNDLQAAKAHLTELVADAPDNDDIRGLMQWVDERLKAPAAGKKMMPFPDVFGVVERSWFEEGDRQSAENQKAQDVEAKRFASLSDVPAAAVTDPSMEHVVPSAAAARPSKSMDPSAESMDASAESSQLSEVAPKKGGFGKVVVVLLLLLIAGGAAAAALVPLPYQLTGTYELAARNSLNVEVAREGVVGSVAVKDGDWVDAGGQLFSYDTEVAKKKLNEVEKKVAELQKKAAKSGPGKKAADARKKLEKAQGALKDAQEDLEKAKEKGKKPAVAKQEKKVKKAEGAVAKAQKAFDSASKAGAAGGGGDAKAELDKAIAERDGVKAQSEAAPFNAPTAGFVRELKVKAGDEVKLGAVVCLLDDTKVLTVKMAAPKGESLKEGQMVTLSVGGKKVDVKVEKIINGEARGSIDNAKGELKPGEKGSTSIETGGRTLLSKYL